MGLRGGRWTTSTTMIDRCEKSHRAENLSFFSHSTFCTSTAATHHTVMMYQIGGRKEVTDLVWRLPRRRLGSRPPWLVGGYSLANLPSKNTLTTTQQRLLTHRDQNGRQQPPWCPTHSAGAYNSRPECWLNIVCGGPGSEAPWRLWDDSGHHGQWGTV